VAAPVFLIGTGTSVGKTHFAERLLRGLTAENIRACGYKPVESGVADPSDPSTDAARIARASPFHVKPALVRFTFARPVSAHLAAREAGREVDLGTIRGEILRGAALAEVLLVELPGGAFSPLTDSVLAAEFTRTVPGARALLVASDRLGVLHDVCATVRACASLGRPIDGIVLSAPATPDESTGSNAAELVRFTSVPILASLERGAANAPLAKEDPVRAIARGLART
jgi:dethiobiotin synthetase